MAIDIIKERARWLGFPPDVAAAVATLESGGRPDALGDATEDPRGYIDPLTGKRWASLGAFQENVAGGAGETFLRRGGTIAGLFDPVTATERFVDRYRGAADVAFLGETPGQIAARAQRPANPTAYAAAVDSLIARMDGGRAPAVTTAPVTSSPAARAPIAGTAGVPATEVPQCPTGTTYNATTGMCESITGLIPPFRPDFKKGTPAEAVEKGAGGLLGDIGNGIKEGVLGALPTVVILVVILLLAYKGVMKTIEV